VSVDVEWSKDHVLAICAYTLIYFRYYCWIKWRLGVPLGGSVEHSKGKDGESAMAIPRFMCGRPRLCWLRTEGLVLVSKY
jgi:hypothetical protein